MAYRTAYRSRYRRHRRRRRNSHWGVLVLLLLVVLIAIPVGIKIVSGLSGALLGGGSNRLVFQLDGEKALQGSDVIELGGRAPYADENGVAFVPLQTVCDNLKLTLNWDQAAKTISVENKKTSVSGKVGSKNLSVGGEQSSLSAAPKADNGTLFVPAKEFCEALSLRVNETDTSGGNLIIVSRSNKDMSEKMLASLRKTAAEKLGPSHQQLEETSVIMRAGSDKLLKNGQTTQMTDGSETRGVGVLEQDGVRYVPLKAAITALGGTAEFDGKKEWTVECNGISSTVKTNGTVKADGSRVRGDNIQVYTDEESSRFYVSAQAFAALLGQTYTDLADSDGTFVFTDASLDGFDEQKTYLDTMKAGLTDAVSSSIPEADVYVALTFDDGPTGATDTYPNGYTAQLLDELKQRNVHATFFMCGYRVKDFNSHMERYLAEGHELGNHTMDHPNSRLTHLDADSVRDQVESNSELIASYTGQKPTVMRPVGGGVNDTVKEQMKALGLPIINWSLDTEDWKTKTDADSVKNKIVDNVKDGDIVLMHDIWPGTFPGVLAAIDELQSRTDKTYAFVTVSELAAIKGVTLEPGTVYSNFSDSTVQAIKDGTYQETIFD